MRDTDYNIVVCTNSNYAKYIPALFNSISFHTKAGIAFYVVYSSITEDQNTTSPVIRLQAVLTSLT